MGNVEDARRVNLHGSPVRPAHDSGMMNACPAPPWACFVIVLVSPGLIRASTSHRFARVVRNASNHGGGLRLQEARALRPDGSK
jgi:hypothetical protein